MLAGAARRSTEAIEGPRHGGQVGLAGALLEAHHPVIAAASPVAVLALLVVCVVLLWLLLRSRDASGT
jgi:hypothetical protein